MVQSRCLGGFETNPEAFVSEHTTTQSVLFPGIFKRPVVAKFDQPQSSSDGGAVLLKAADRELGLTGALAACLKDDRQEAKVRHELAELLTQRIMAIACGYEDANDAARLACDPVHKLLVGRDPVEGEDLASQPTLSRFEHSVGRKEVFRMAEALADTVIERHRKRLRGRARLITVSAKASAMRNNSLRPTLFSKRDKIGCEAKSSPSTGSRPTNSLCTGSQARRAASLASS